MEDTIEDLDEFSLGIVFEVIFSEKLFESLNVGEGRVRS